MPNLEEVFKTSGVPTYTFVEPQEYPRLLIGLRTAGRSVIIEGPSGIGKTTAVMTALSALKMGDHVTLLSARNPQDIEYIAALPSLGEVGTVIIDDFHRLDTEVRASLADYMKTLADSENKAVKVVVLGINRAGENLIDLANDLVNRITIIRFEQNPDFKVTELIEKGEAALNASFNVGDEIVETSNGSFYLAQMFCQEILASLRIMETSDSLYRTEVSMEQIKSTIWDRLGAVFRERCELFCLGVRRRIEGRAPYLHILNWLANSGDWTLSLDSAIRTNTKLGGSAGQVVKKGFLEKLVEENDDIKDVLHFDAQSHQLTVEDPQFLFFIRNIPWKQFAHDLGYKSIEFSRRYDFALSFAGSNRDVAEALFNSLAQRDVEVFYDRNEQYRMLAKDIEEYLLPIYQSEAESILVILGPDYPERYWTRMESNAFKERLGDGSVVPIYFSNAPPSPFDEARRLGGIVIDRAKSLEQQIEAIADQLMLSYEESREA